MSEEIRKLELQLQIEKTILEQQKLREKNLTIENDLEVKKMVIEAELACNINWSNKEHCSHLPFQTFADKMLSRYKKDVNENNTSTKILH